MKKVGWAVLILTLGAALWYTALSLARWEWNRALFFGLVFVASEVAVGIAWILTRLGRGDRELAGRAPDARTLARLRETRSERRRFEWLSPIQGRTNVFITLLVGGGIVVSAAAWVVDQLAARTAVPAGERALAEDLTEIAYPEDGLLVDEVTALAHDLPYLDDPQLRKLLRQPGHPR